MENEKNSKGLIITIIIIIIIVLGGLFWWMTKDSKTSITKDSSDTTADEVKNIENELNSSDLKGLDTELDKLNSDMKL